MSKGKKSRKNELQQYNTLDKFLTPIIEKFSFRPDKDFARYLFGIFNNQKIFYYAINAEMCFTLEEFKKYLDIPYKTIQRAFNRITKKTFEETGDLLFISGRDFFKIDREHFLPMRQNVSLVDNPNIGQKTGKKIIMLTFLGTWKLLPTFRGDIPIRLYHWFGEKLYALMKSNQLSSGEFFFTNKIGRLVHQIIGDKKKCYVDEFGFMYSSKGEMLIAKTLRQLNIYFQYNAPINLPNRVLKKLRKDYPKEILLEAGWQKIPPYITADFLLRIIPRTIIEYWGLKGNSKYNAKREIKEFIYRELKIRCISIEEHEDQNIPVLKKKLIKELEIEV